MSTIPSLSIQPSDVPLEWMCSQTSIDVEIDVCPSETTWHVSDSNNNMIPICSGGVNPTKQNPEYEFPNLKLLLQT